MLVESVSDPSETRFCLTSRLSGSNGPSHSSEDFLTLMLARSSPPTCPECANEMEARKSKLWQCRECSGVLTAASNMKWILKLTEAQANPYFGGYTVFPKREQIVCPFCTVEMEVSSPMGYVHVTKTCPGCASVWWRQGSYSSWKTGLPEAKYLAELERLSEEIQRARNAARAQKLGRKAAAMVAKAPRERSAQRATEVATQAYRRAYELAKVANRARLVEEWQGFDEETYRSALADRPESPRLMRFLAEAILEEFRTDFETRPGNARLIEACRLLTESWERDSREVSTCASLAEVWARLDGFEQTFYWFDRARELGFSTDRSWDSTPVVLIRHLFGGLNAEECQKKQREQELGVKAVLRSRELGVELLGGKVVGDSGAVFQSKVGEVLIDFARRSVALIPLKAEEPIVLLETIDSLGLLCKTDRREEYRYIEYRLKAALKFVGGDQEWCLYLEASDTDPELLPVKPARRVCEQVAAGLKMPLVFSTPES